MNHILVIDTFKVTPEGIHLHKFHLNRTLDCLTFLKSSIPKNSIMELYEKYSHSDYEEKVRFEINPNDLTDIRIEKSSIDSIPTVINLEIARFHDQASGYGLHNYKTNQRDYWNKNLALKSSNSFDIIGINSAGHITETSRFNLFFKRGNLLYTPPLDSGCLNGCLRQSLISEIIEANIQLSDIGKYEVFAGNSLRGLLPARIQTKETLP